MSLHNSRRHIHGGITIISSVEEMSSTSSSTLFLSVPLDHMQHLQMK